MGRKDIHKILSEQDMQQVAEVIREIEKTTEGEIRVALREKRHWGEGKLSLHQLALKEFHRLGVHKTEKHIGVLIFLLISERKFHIMADEGIHARVEDGTWDALAEQMSRHFREGKFYDGICATAHGVGDILAKHFPAKAGNIDELPDNVSVS
ncbi:MAG: TPM domain-containing protein [Bacteroidota bacterium]